jgi:2',3'-cyclic-nucleotide 2'-phosphodiesterase (5'-nucleotidase family)
LKSLLSVTGADAAFSNGWRYGVPIQPGQLTLEDLHRIIPVNPPVSTAVLSGQEIWDMLEENLHHTFSGDPYEQMGGYVKRAMGLKAFIKVENPNTLRLQQVFIGNEPLEKAAAYRVAYVTKQGVPKEKYGREHKDLEIHAVDAIRQLLQKGPYADDSPAAFEVV